MAEKALSTYTYEAYLALEAERETKYEFHDGYITAMAGGSPEHGLIAINFSSELRGKLREANKRCAVYPSDVKVRIESANRTFYPDAFVVCGESKASDIDKYAITNPILILEVLSESTVDFDRGAKFHHYRQLSSFREYVLISQKEPQVDTYYRTDQGTWEIRTFTSLDETILLKSLGVEIGMEDVYYLVEGMENR